MFLDIDIASSLSSRLLFFISKCEHFFLPLLRNTTNVWLRDRVSKDIYDFLWDSLQYITIIWLYDQRVNLFYFDRYSNYYYR
jgi:hypothetical protein